MQRGDYLSLKVLQVKASEKASDKITFFDHLLFQIFPFIHWKFHSEITLVEEMEREPWNVKQSYERIIEDRSV